MTLLFHALWMLCGFGAVVFAAASIRGWWSAGFAAAGVLLGIASATPRDALDPAWIAALAALVAMLALAWPRHWILTSLSAGALAGIWSTLFQAQGLPLAAALIVAAAVVALSAWLAARRPAFAPSLLRDEALLVVFVLAVAVAMAPEVLDGWRAALNLAVDARSAGQGVPAWTLALSLVSFAFGGLYTLWSRR